MSKCDICGKVPSSGHNVSHSNRHTKTRWHPNVHRVRLSSQGKRRPANMCTRCLRSRLNVRLQA